MPSESESGVFQVYRVEPRVFAIEITCGGQSIRYEAPTAEEVIGLAEAHGRTEVIEPPDGGRRPVDTPPVSRGKICVLPAAVVDGFDLSLLQADAAAGDEPHIVDGGPEFDCKCLTGAGPCIGCRANAAIATAVAVERERCLLACELARPPLHRGKACGCGECIGALIVADEIRKGAS